MHILLTSNAANTVLTIRRPILDAMLADGHKVTVLAPRDDAVALLEAIGCHFAPLKMDAKSLSPLSGMELTRQFRRQFRTLKPDAVFSYTIKNNIFGAIAARKEGVPFLPNITGLGTAFLSGNALQKVAEFLYRRAFRALPVVFFQNTDDRDLFLARGLIRRDQARLLPGSGIDLDHFAPRAGSRDGAETVFLMIARLLRDKGAMEYAAAAGRVRRSHPEARFQLLGPLGTENRTAIPAEELENWQRGGDIEYLGEYRDVRDRIAAADCIVLPSYREGAPRTLIEGAAMARPLIATDVPGCRAVVEEGETGLLCRPKDPESLAEACERMIAMGPEARAAMGAAGRLKMERDYDQAIVVAAYQQVVSQRLV